jgi:hypothetical protein
MNDNDNNNKYQINNITSFLEICENIFNNWIIKYKFTFMDILLNEWYNINKTLITDKINDLENINSIYIYNCHKYIIYIIFNIFDKYKTKIILNVFNIYNIDKMKNELITLRKFIFNDLKMKINNNEINSKNDLLSIKALFFNFLITKNMKSLQKDNLIEKKYINTIVNKNKEIYLKINLFASFLNWKLNNDKFNNIESDISFYLYNIKYFQCKAIISIYKNKLKHIFILFINKILSKNKIILIKKKKTKNEILLLSLTYQFDRTNNSSKLNFFEKIISFYYLRTKTIFLFYIISFIFNNIINKYKNLFINNFKLFINKIENNRNLARKIISNFILFKNQKITSFTFNVLKKIQHFKTVTNISNKKAININILYNEKNFKILIKLLTIYNIHRNFEYWKNKQNFSIYFNKWKLKAKLCEFKENNQINNLFKKKFESYNNKNIILKNKLQIIIQKNRKKKINNNIKENINNKKNKNKKLVLSKDIANIIKNKNENINKSDNLKLAYLCDLEELKNKNESIIFNLQSDINNLVKEIESLSVDI